MHPTIRKVIKPLIIRITLIWYNAQGVNAMAQKDIAEEPIPPTEPEADYHEIIHAKLLGGTVIRVRKENILGYCRNINHPGKLTKALLEEHQCLTKKCPLLEKYDVPFWAAYRKKQLAKEEAKRQKREKKARARTEAASLAELRDELQKYADAAGKEVDVIRVERLNWHTYKVFYVSDYAYDDCHRFRAFLTAARSKYGYVMLRHIRGEDGHYVTRGEYYARKP